MSFSTSHPNYQALVSILHQIKLTFCLAFMFIELQSLSRLVQSFLPVFSPVLVIFLLLWQNTWQKNEGKKEIMKEGRERRLVYFGSQFQAIQFISSGAEAGVWSCASHCLQRQEAERNECCFSAPLFLPLFHSAQNSSWMVCHPPSEWISPPQLHLSGNTLMHVLEMCLLSDSKPGQVDSEINHEDTYRCFKNLNRITWLSFLKPHKSIPLYWELKLNLHNLFVLHSLTSHGLSH